MTRLAEIIMAPNDLNIPVVRVSITLPCQTVERKRR